MSTDPPSSQLSIIVDLTSAPFDFQALYKQLSSEPPASCEHHYWHFAGLRAYTIAFQSTNDQRSIDNIIDKLKSIQNLPSPLSPFWVSHKKTLQAAPSNEVINKNAKLAKFVTNAKFQVAYTSGALLQLDKYAYDLETGIDDAWALTFYHDRIDMDYGPVDKRKRKVLKADMMDRCAVVTTNDNGFSLFINLSGNPIEYKTANPDDHPSQTTAASYIRTASREAQPFYTTVRLVVSLTKGDKPNEFQRRLKSCYTQFIEFFQRNHINDCYGVIQSVSSTRALAPPIALAMANERIPFIKQYCWQMLLSIGYRFQQRLTTRFIQKMNRIEDDDEFYQASLHIWRRSSEYYFINLVAELRRYQEKTKALILSATPTNPSHPDRKKNRDEQERWSIHRPPAHYAYVPSVTLTPTTICVNPMKLVKTNRVLREQKFGGNLMFALVDVKEENQTMDLFPHDYRSLRWKTEMLLESGFDIGQSGRTYRYLHHSQSQLKDKQFWFYHHDPEKNFSFEEAFVWMGDFQDERIVAKHSARIAQCFTSAEATIQIPSHQVQYIDDIHTDDSKYNFTDGVGTMSTSIRDNIHAHRQFSAIQIRYGGCKGVISVNPDLDNSPHQLRIRQSMKKFKCSHDILELCRISKPRPLYLNRQIIVLLSHRSIDDRTFLLLQNEHQQILSESLVYPQRAYELLSEKLNRTLFPLRSLTHDAHLNLIQEPFFRQLIIAIGKLELGQMRERTRLKLPKNTARNMIGIVDEYGILEYGQVFIQYTELTNDYLTNTESDKLVILEQKVVVTKNPCHHPGDVRVFSAVDVPRLRHLKDVIVFPQRGKRPHPNEISGSDLDGDEYAVIWHPAFIPNTVNDTPYDYDSQIPMLRINDRPVNRADIQATVLDISEQSCVGKLCSLHLAYMDLHGVAHPKTLAIAGHISEELDAPKTGQHPLTPKQITELQSELSNERPDYFDKPYYKLYPSKHVIGQLFRSCLRFEPNWLLIQAPPTTTSPLPIDPLLVHDSHTNYTASVQELARTFRESIMDIMYVYRFSSDVDLLCRYDSSSPQSKAPLSKQQTESACLIADSAQVEFKQLIRRIRRLFFQDISSPEKPLSHRCHPGCEQCAEKKRAKASALYIFCYTDTSHARRMLSLPWLFASLLIETRKLNIKKQTKLISPMIVAQMLEIQPYRLIGQALRHAANHIVHTRKSFYFHHISAPDTITVSLRPTSTAKRLILKRTIAPVDYLLIEILHHYHQKSIAAARLPITSSKPVLVDGVWQHILTRLVLDECSSLILVSTSNASASTHLADLNGWSDERACKTLQRLIEISAHCANHGPDMMDYTHANEYLVLALQQMATTGCLFPVDV